MIVIQETKERERERERERDSLFIYIYNIAIIIIIYLYIYISIYIYITLTTLFTITITITITLSLMQVRHLRRTSRDILVFIPFIIILILPLTPIGHVAVFAFLQKYFPDVFPSQLSIRRQEIMLRYVIVIVIVIVTVMVMRDEG